MKLIILVSLFVIGYLTGRQIEVKHFRSLRDREERFRHIATVNSQWRRHIEPDCESHLFDGSVVVGADYFKTVISGLRNIFGGNLSTFETLLDRGRREAILRMLENADAWGAEKILNVRIESTDIGGEHGKKVMPCVEIHVYGTGVRKAQHETHR